MYFKTQKTNAIFSILIIISILSGNVSYRAQDIISTDDISGGSSVFVFRQSKFKPQIRSGAHNFFLRNISGRAVAARSQSRKKTNSNPGRKISPAKSDSALINKKGSKIVNAPISKNNLSNTLTAKGDTLLKMRATDQAINAYQEALKINPQNATAKQGLGKAYAAKGDEAFRKNGIGDVKFDEAIFNYEKALANNPALSELFVPLANINYQKGDFSRAEDYLSKAENNTGNSAETELLRGLIHLKRNENNEALANFTRSININPKNAEAYFYQAQTYDRLKLSQEAQKTYRKAIEIDPKFTEAWFDLAVLNYNKGDFKESVTLYKEVIALDKDHSAAHANIASAYRQLEKYADANGEYKIAAGYIKNDPDLFSEWGYCLGKVAEWEKAIARLQTAKDLSPGSIDYTNLGWAYFNAAQKDMDNQNKAKARTELNQGKVFLQKAIELDPKSDAAFLNLGVTYSKLGEYQNAVNALNKANSLRQKWVFGINELGLAYRNFNKYSEAINQFQKAVNIDENFASGYFNLGEAQYKNGKKKDAKKTLEKLKQLNPGLALKLEDIMNGPVIQETD